MITVAMLLRYLGIELLGKRENRGVLYYTFARELDQYYQAEIAWEFDPLPEEMETVEHILVELSHETDLARLEQINRFFSGLFSSEALGELFFWMLVLANEEDVFESDYRSYSIQLFDLYEMDGKQKKANPKMLAEGVVEATTLLEAKKFLALHFLLSELMTELTSQYGREVVSVLQHMKKDGVDGWSMRKYWPWNIVGEEIELEDKTLYLRWRK